MSSYTELWAKEEWNKFEKKDLKKFSGKIVFDNNTDGGSMMGRSNPYKLQTESALIDIYW
jgi:hypothetical protein